VKPGGSENQGREGYVRVALALAVIAVATFLVYANTFDAPFQFDDFKNVVLYGPVRSLRGLWSDPRVVGYLSFALNYRFGGLDVVGYHLVNVAIHAANAVLVYWLVATVLRCPTLRERPDASMRRRHLPLVASLLFALHPVQTQAVTYVVQRFASLATFFFLLSVVLYARARLAALAEPTSRARVVLLACASMAAAAAGFKTKEIAFTLPMVLLGFEWLFFRPRRRLVAALPFFALAVLLLPIDLLTRGRGVGAALGDQTQFAAETQHISRWSYLLTQSRVVLTYLRLLVWPVGQNLDYDYPLSRSIAEPAVLFSLAMLAALIAVAVVLLRRDLDSDRSTGVLLFAGVAWFLATLSVESSIVPIRDVINEHRLYLPSVGAAIAFGAGLLHLLDRLPLRATFPTRVGVALCLTCAPLGVATFARNRVWQDEARLWTDVVSKSPAKARGHEALGLEFLSRCDIDRAVDEFSTALGSPDRTAIRAELLARIGPARAVEATRIAELCQERGQLEGAERKRREAACLSPASAAVHVNLGATYHLQGKLEEAVAEYRRALQLDPALVQARENLLAAFEATAARSGSAAPTRGLDPR
jgi:hypothetical protein